MVIGGGSMARRLLKETLIQGKMFVLFYFVVSMNNSVVWNHLSIWCVQLVLRGEFHENKKGKLIVRYLLILDPSIPHEQHNLDLSFVQFGRFDI